MIEITLVTLIVTSIVVCIFIVVIASLYANTCDTVKYATRFSPNGVGVPHNIGTPDDNRTTRYNPTLPSTFPLSSKQTRQEKTDNNVIVVPYNDGKWMLTLQQMKHEHQLSTSVEFVVVSLVDDERESSVNPMQIVDECPPGHVYKSHVWYRFAELETFRARVLSGHESIEWPLMMPDITYLKSAPALVSVTKARTRHRKPPTTSRLIHQTWKSRAQLTPGTVKAMETLIKLNDDCDHWFWSNDACHEFIHKHFDPRIALVYDRLVPGAYKADLWRLCCLYVFGGLYVDIDMEFACRMSDVFPKHERLCLTLDDVTKIPTDNLHLYNAIIAANSGDEFLITAIRRLLKNVADTDNKLMVANELLVTGPGCLGQAFTDMSLPNTYIKLVVLPKDSSQTGIHDRAVATRDKSVIVAATKYDGYLTEKIHTGIEYNTRFKNGTWIKEHEMSTLMPSLYMNLLLGGGGGGGARRATRV
jgi:hypothetical protein